MHQTKKGNQWYFGMKAHIGVDAKMGLAHSLATTAANVSDVATAHAVLHGGEESVHGDAGYQGVGRRPENRDAGVDWQTAMKPGKRRQLDRSGPAEAAEKVKASVRAKAEHPFLYLKRHFGYAKVRYRGLAKNTQRIALLLGFAQSADRGPLRPRLNAGALRPFSAGTAGNGTEGGYFDDSEAIFGDNRKHLPRRQWILPLGESVRDGSRRPETRLDQTFPRALRPFARALRSELTDAERSRPVDLAAFHG